MDNYQQENHEMMFERVAGQDTDELFCPVCGRRILIQWSPDFKKTVLEAGDEYAIHTASKGGLKIGAPQPSQPEQEVAEVDPERIAQWELWLEDIDFESLWR